MLFLGLWWNALDILRGIFSLAGRHFCLQAGYDASISWSSQLPRPLPFPRLQAVPSYSTSTSSVCTKTWEDPRHFSGALSLHSCLLSHASPTNSSSLQAPTLLCLGSASLPVVHRAPLGRKLSWSGPHLCVSLLCRNIVLYFLFSDNWKWLLFLYHAVL